MSKAEELLNGLSESDISLQSANPETEPHIVIGDDRFISVPAELQRIAVQYDHDVETVTFDCPRYWDDLDMSELSIYINYMRKDREVGVYKATDISVDTANDRIMHFNWKISRNVTEVVGSLKFLICIKKGDADGNEVNHWNSELNAEMYISEGLEVEPSIFDPYPDIITQWEDEVQRVKDILLAARDAGEFDGATFTPSVDDDGNLSWTNDKGKANPATKNIKGYSPAIIVREIEGGKQLIITDSRQSQTVTIMDGTDGISPAVIVKDIDGGHQLIITERGNPAKTVDILDGKDGVSPAVIVRDIEGGHQLLITERNNPTKTVDVMDGTDGVSPTVTITNISGGHRVTITDKDGAKAFDVMDGTTEISEAVKDYIGNYMYIGEVEPSSGPTLWFDTSATSVG